MFGVYDERSLEEAEPVPEAEAIRSTSRFLGMLARALVNSRTPSNAFGATKKPCTPCEKRKAALLQQAQAIAGR